MNFVLSHPDVCSSEPLQLFIKQGKEDTDFVPKKRSSTIESDIDIASLLYKFRNNKWKSRWYVLRHGILYKYQSSLDKHPCGFLDVRASFAYQLEEEDSKIKSRPFVFCVEEKNLTKKSGQPIIRYFAAENEESMKKWIAKINNEVIQSNIYRVFGTPIDQVRDRDVNGVPLFLSSLLTFLEATAMDREDLFTQPPDEEIKRQIDRGKLIDVAKVVEDVHAVAGLIVQYLHELPEPVIPTQYHDLFFGIFKLEDEKMRKKMLNHFSEILPIVNRNILLKLFSFLEKTSNGAVKIERLIKIFGRLVLRPPQSMDNNTINFITRELITNWDCMVVPDEVYDPSEMFVVVKRKKEDNNNAMSTENEGSTINSVMESEDSSEAVYTESEEFSPVSETNGTNDEATSDAKDNNDDKELSTPKKKKSKKSKRTLEKKKSSRKKKRTTQKSSKDRHKHKKKSSRKIKRSTSKNVDETQKSGDEDLESESEKSTEEISLNNSDNAKNIDDTTYSEDTSAKEKNEDVTFESSEQENEDTSIKEESTHDDVSEDQEKKVKEKKKSVKFNVESEEDKIDIVEEHHEDPELEIDSQEKSKDEEEVRDQNSDKEDESSESEDSSQEMTVDSSLVIPEEDHKPLSAKIRPKVRRTHKPTNTRITVEYNRPASHLSPQQQLIADLTRVLNVSRIEK